MPRAEAAASPGASPVENGRSDRPGLATAWGEQRRSPVRETRFERASDHPFAVATLYYNDRAGVGSMVALAAAEGAAPDGEVRVSGGLGISVVGEDGAPLPSLGLGGRTYVVGEDGARYQIVVRNHTGRRYEVVGSVDGLDVIDGHPAGLDKRGYLIAPFGTLVIDGFRRTSDEVAAFRFGAVADSYAARSGSDRNAGVIGIALFGESGRYAAPPSLGDPAEWPEEARLRQSATPFGDRRFAIPPG